MVDIGHAGVLAPGRWRWARALGWMVLLFLGLGLVFGLGGNLLGRLLALVAGVPGHGLKAAPEWIKATTLTIAVVATYGVYMLAVRGGEKRPVSELAWRPALPEWAAGLAIGAVLMGLTVGAMALLGFVDVGERPVRAIGQALRGTLQSGAIEELLFRLVIFRLVWRAAGIWWALGLSALLFGGLHLTNPNASPFAALCIALEAGILLAAFYILTGRLWASIGVHMGWNFTQGWVLGAAVSGTDGFAGGPLATLPKAQVADWLDGGGFGPEASLPALLVCTAAGLWVLRRAWLAGQFRQPVEVGRNNGGVVDVSAT